MQFITRYHIIGNLTPIVLLWILLYVGVAYYSGRNVWSRLGDVVWCRLEGIHNGVRTQTDGDFLVEALTMVIALAFLVLGILAAITPGPYLLFLLLMGAALKLVRSHISRATRESVLGSLQLENTPEMIRRYVSSKRSGKIPPPRTAADVEEDIVSQLDDLEAKGNGGIDMTGVHTEHEDHPWTIDIGDHPQRKDSPIYIQARRLMVAIVRESQPWFLGDPPYQDHHGGGIWVHTEKSWRLFRNLAGIEWSAQFCCDPAKVDILRLNAAALVDAFPGTLQAYKDLTEYDWELILRTPITDAQGVARWTDSIFNASVPLTAIGHTGVLPKGGGVHHYPEPITDIEYVKTDDFQLWVTDDQGQPAAVVPMGPRGSGDGRVQVVYSTPQTHLYVTHMWAHVQGQALVLPPDHDMAVQAFNSQK